ncbi:primase-helicase family protein [Bradyrhizobium sp. McL0615]|uniref:primase-helicase family protein n=1 Tax=Bradyrhizobium sp. McL0615 TaxID=3415673 RepID=UPI003CF7F35E
MSRDANDVLREHGPDALRHAFDSAPRLTANGQDGTDCGSGGVQLEDFAAYMPQHCYIFKPTRETWPASSVNARVPPVALGVDEDGKQKFQSASAWLDQNRAVEQMTWSPGDPMLVDGRLISEGGWIRRPGCRVFNLYRPPNIEPGNAAEADRWLEHVFKVFGDSDQHIVKWLAHRVQRPHEKINHALVLSGHQGIGKDTLLEPVKHAVGPWNFAEVSPQHMLGRFNGFLKSVILRVSEARDLGDTDRFAFYDHMKAYTAAPPDVLRVDEKHLREYAILNVAGVIITTNHLMDGIYLPADDRRHFVAWSDLTKEDFVTSYWRDLWAWFGKGGIRHVAAYLAELDLTGFDPKAPPPKTDAFWSIVDSNRAPEDAELADVLDALNNPPVTTLDRIKGKALGDFHDWLADRKNRRAIPHRLERCGYVPVRNDTREDGLWIVRKVRKVIYARKDMSLRDRLSAARNLAEQ